MLRLIGLIAACSFVIGLTSSVAVPAPAPVTAWKGIEWAASYEGAFDAAAEDRKIVFIAVNMDGERANDRVAEDVYADKTIVALAEKTVNLIGSADRHSKSGKCPRFGCESCEAHRFADISIREQILKAGPSGAVIAPQHVFCEPDGTVLLSVPYEVTATELEWCFHEALAMNEGVEPAKRRHPGRRPRRLIVGDVVDLGGDATPITREEALEIIKEHKKGGSGGDREEMLRRLVTADEPEAREYILTVLRAGGGGGGGGRGSGGGGRGEGADRQRGRLVRWIGVASPASYWEICAEFADSGSESIQAEAIVALEQIAAEDSLPMLMKALRRAATDPEGQRRLVRAIGATARGDKKARAAILRASIDRKNDALRANALIALGWLYQHEDVAQRLREAARPDVHGKKAKIAPEKVTPSERLGAVVAMGISRDSAWKETLQAIADDEDADEKLRNAARASVAVIDGGAYARLARFQEDAGGDEIPRERLFGNVKRGG